MATNLKPVATGRAWAVEQMIDPQSFMALGSGSSEVTDSDIDLESELGRVTMDSVTTDGDTLIFQATFPPGVATGEVREIGIFSSDGVLITRGTVGLKTKELEDEYVYIVRMKAVNATV